MSYDEGLAARVRRILADRTDVVEKKMFGGLCSMVSGAMCCGLTKTDFMVRVGPANYDAALREPHARPMDFTGRPLAGMVYVAPEGLRKDTTLAKWVDRGVRFVEQQDGAKIALRAKKVDPRVSRLLAALKADRELAAIVDAFLASRSAGSEWLTITSPKASWLALAREAYEFVRG